MTVPGATGGERPEWGNPDTFVHSSPNTAERFSARVMSPSPADTIRAFPSFGSPSHSREARTSARNFSREIGSPRSFGIPRGSTSGSAFATFQTAIQAAVPAPSAWIRPNEGTRPRPSSLSDLDCTQADANTRQTNALSTPPRLERDEEESLSGTPLREI